MATFISHNPAATEELGESWGKAVENGLVIGLSGDLGAGKTQLVKGLARGLGVTERVHSPTFALVNIYTGGRLSLYHLDLYRLDTREQIRSAGLEEYLKPDGVTVIEWVERWMGAGRQWSVFSVQYSVRKLRLVRFEVLDEAKREITYEDLGA